MDFQEQIKLIKERREAEAIQKKLPNKLRVVAKYCGSTIRGQSSYGEGDIENPTVETMDILDGYDDIEEEDVPTMPMSHVMAELQDKNLFGYYFDGLGQGINLQIKFMEEDNILQVYYNSDIVYYELHGELQAYVPIDEWEDKVDAMFKFVKLKLEKNEDNEKEKNELKSIGFINKFVEYVKKTWGVK